MERGVTLREVADKTGVHYTTIAKALERGTAHPSTAKALAKYGGVPMRDILVNDEKTA